MNPFGKRDPRLDHLVFERWLFITDKAMDTASSSSGSEDEETAEECEKEVAERFPAVARGGRAHLRSAVDIA